MESGTALLKALISRPFAEWGVDASAQVIDILYPMVAWKQTDPGVEPAAATAQKIILSNSILGIASGLHRTSEEAVSFADMTSLATEILNSDARPDFEIRTAGDGPARHVANG